jgi:hypothetical protein
MKHFAEIPPGGRSHLAIDGSLTVNEQAMLSSQMATSPSVPLRGRPAVRKLQETGGVDSVVLGSESAVYECGVKEAHYRLATDDALKRAVAAAVPAGGRPAEKEVHTRGSVGGPDHMGDVWQYQNIAYSEGTDEAQRRSALDPAARASVEAQPMAGLRVDRAQGLRVTRGAGGDATYSMAWSAEAPAVSGSIATQSRMATDPLGVTPRILRPEHPVGAHSAHYVGGILPSASADDMGGGVRRVQGAVAGQSTMPSLLVFDPHATVPQYGSSGKQRLQMQPLGGRHAGGIAIGHSLDASDSKVGSWKTHQISSVMLG